VLDCALPGWAGGRSSRTQAEPIMARGETGKQRQTRIELQYYKRPDAMARWRARLILATIILASLWFGLAPIWDRRAAGPIRLFQWERLASPGPLARVHSMWESSCEACHVPFRPLNDSHVTPLASADTRLSNERCQACHAGPTHHASQVPRELACTVCHHDHRGTEASLVRLDDAACTTCHANLESHRDKNVPPIEPAIANAVTRFDNDPNHHQEFHAVRNQEDRGQLKFNHALHRAPGYTLEKGAKILTFAQVQASERSRFGWTSRIPLDAPVPPLSDCYSCHRLDNAEYAGSSKKGAGEVVSPRVAGTYMLPVTYENHCRACHPLNFDPKAPDALLTHGLSPGDALSELRQFYKAQAVDADPSLLQRFVPPRTRPGEPESPAPESIGRAVDDKVLTAVRMLFGAGISDDAMRKSHIPQGRKGCALCHHLAEMPGPLVRADAIKGVEIEPVRVPNVWFNRAVFDHSAHRAVDCKDCHAGAETSRANTDVLVPGIAVCIQCHGPSAGRGDTLRGGAGDSCTECHRFHNGDHPLEGIGASSRGVNRRQGRTIDQFLQGSPRRQNP
jgi:Cytochrome c7 and related cytochrome c